MPVLIRLAATFALLHAVGGSSSAPPCAPDGTLDLEPFRGKVVYLDFWASWCRPCRSSFKWMDQMHERYGNDGLVILAVNVDSDREEARRFLEKYDPAFAVAFDDGKVMAAAYDLDGMPASFVYDRTGQLRLAHVGFRDGDNEVLEREFKQLLDTPGAGGND